MDYFSKINLAACAMRRAEEHILDKRRFSDEYKTALLWKGHRVYQTVNSQGRPMGWMTLA